MSTKKIKRVAVAAKTNNESQRLVINQLVVKSPQRKLYDIGTWRTALLSADNGRCKQLYDLFDDIMIDGILSDAVQKRIDAVINSEISFVDKNGKSIDVMDDMIDSPGFEDLLTEIVKARMYGRSGVELDFSDGFKATSIPAKHISLRNHSILIHDIDETGIPYDNDSSLLIIGKDRDFGLLLKAAPYAIYKRGGFGDWSQWIELFGMPQRVGKYNTFDSESRKLLVDAFEQAGSAPYVVVPKETDIETKETNSGSGTSYNEFRQACNEEMLITILGQTLTTISGERGARSLGEVHKQVEEGKNKSDLRYVQRILNRCLLPVLEARGYPVSGGKFIFPKAAEQLSVDEIISLSDIMDIPKSYLHEKYSIPIPEDGEAIAKRSSSLTQANGDDIDEVVITNSDRSFVERLRDFFVGAPQDGASKSGKALISLSDNATFEQRLIYRIASGQSTQFDSALYDYISHDLLSAVRTVFKDNLNNADIQYTYGMQDDAFITAMEMNLFHFSAGKTLAEVQELNKLLRESHSYMEFERKASQVCETFNKKWQQAEYDTAVSVAQSARNYQELRANTKSFPYWEYSTAGDNRVREMHRLLDGVILGFEDGRWKKIFPPNGWKCRCTILPRTKFGVTPEILTQSRQRVDAYLASPEWRKLKAQGWDINRGESAQVFTANQQYTRKFPNMATKKLGNLGFADYGLDAFAKRAAHGTFNMPVFNGDKSTWLKDHQVLIDYNGRTVQMQGNVFTIHTRGKYAKTRVALLDCIPDVLHNPDEVWMNDYVNDGRFRNLNCIKYYKDKAICVVCEIKNTKVYQVSTWFEIAQGSTAKGTDNPKLKYRRGLLIKK